jgi:hypothetical protein
VHGVKDVRQSGMLVGESLVPESSSLITDVATEKFKLYKSPGIDRIPAELIQVEGNILPSDIHKLINYIWNKEEFLHYYHLTP